LTLEEVRLSYLPKKVKVLFVGESAPAAGTFFYLGDLLTLYTKKAFEKSYSVDLESDQIFLERFKENNFYLDDLCLEPVNRMIEIDREAARHNSVLPLSWRIKNYSPKAIICIMKAIKPYVEDAMKLTNMEGITFYSLPYPRYKKHVEAYKEKLTIVLNELKKAGIVESTF
jgi:hypothetical protein